jgi:hypothetical protein
MTQLALPSNQLPVTAAQGSVPIQPVGLASGLATVVAPQSDTSSYAAPLPDMSVSHSPLQSVDFEMKAAIHVYTLYMSVNIKQPQIQ